MEPASAMESIFKADQKTRISASIFPQQFKYVKLEKIFIKLDSSPCPQGFSVNFELDVRRTDEIEITLIFAYADRWESSLNYEFYFTIDASDATGKLADRKDKPKVHLYESMVAFAYISQIRSKHDQDHWSIEGKEDELFENASKSLERMIKRN